MNMSWSLSPRFEREILICNHHTVHGRTGFHVTILYTSEGDRREHLIKWMEKFTDFASLVRRLLIAMHLGETPSTEKKRKIETAYITFFREMEGDSEEKYLRQYTCEMQAIFTVFQKAVASNAKL